MHRRKPLKHIHFPPCCKTGKKKISRTDLKFGDETWLVALGGNLPSSVGDPAATIGKAVADIAAAGIAIRAVSRLYRTPCIPAGAGPDYVNAALVAEARMEPSAFLALLNRIEARYGRTRQARWAARTLDLDLIAAGRKVLPDAAVFAAWRDLPPEARARKAPQELIVPHPRMHERAFVLIPLAEIAPHWRHPASGLTVLEMLDALDDAEKQGIEPL